MVASSGIRTKGDEFWLLPHGHPRLADLWLCAHLAGDREDTQVRPLLVVALRAGNDNGPRLVVCRSLKGSGSRTRSPNS